MVTNLVSWVTYIKGWLLVIQVAFPMHDIWIIAWSSCSLYYSVVVSCRLVKEMWVEGLFPSFIDPTLCFSFIVCTWYVYVCVCVWILSSFISLPLCVFDFDWKSVLVFQNEREGREESEWVSKGMLSFANTFTTLFTMYSAQCIVPSLF